MLKIGQKVITPWGDVMIVIQPVVGTTSTYVLKGKERRRPSIPVYRCRKESEVIPDDNPNFAKALDALANANMREEEADKFNDEFEACFPQRKTRTSKEIPPAPLN
jgi:hypothetical protein